MRALPERLFDQAGRRGAALALRYKRLGIWHGVTWGEYASRVRCVAAALAAGGLRPRESVAILGENCPEWLYCSLGVMSAGGVSCGVYPTSAPEQVQYILEHSEARVLFVENEEQLEKVMPILSATRVERLVVWDEKGLWGFEGARVSFFPAFLAEGEKSLAGRPDLVEQRLAAIDPDDTAMIIYTSGTTGPPKGAMLSHANTLFMGEAIQKTNGLRIDDDLVSYLPLAHVYENLGTVMEHLLIGYLVNFVENLDTLFLNLREISPTYFASVPRIWEKLASTIELRMADSTPLKRLLYRIALRVGRRYVRAARRPRPICSTSSRRWESHFSRGTG
jgi:long-chain acyl-CoA synthetase